MNMKLKIQLKTPDAVFYATEDLPEEQRDEAQRVANLFFRYGEQLTVEIDTENETCVVLRP